MTYTSESDFEQALILELSKKGWEKAVIKNPTEEDLLRNWADILYENNRDIDRLNDIPLTNGEMQQIIEQITALRTPLKLNSFINGKSVAITRDNPEDKLHLGKEVSLKIYDRHEIAAGQSRYQIVQQPRFKGRSKILHDRRGDLMLLINGMPVIHIELKKSGVHVSQAYNQIEKYAHEGIFSGIFSLIQVFVAMEPNETVYFANPGPDGKFNKDFYFHWADFDNEPLNDWKSIVARLLNIPMAHQLIGFYTVADNSDGILKVMRSYQYYAAHAISDKVAKTNWKDQNLLGGYIWHTTGSGKTMTSFKSAQLIASSKDADKVIFLMDRIELGTQSLREYKAFAGDTEEVQATENTGVLVTKLKSNDPANTLIVTSIQKMSNIKDEADGLNTRDVQLMNAKRIVFIVDEAHRSVFGDMLITIKNTFPSALFFGFTGTPIHEENQKKKNTTADVFGDELHRYSIADGIRDKNVLGFDPYKVLTYKDRDLRKAVALKKANAVDEQDVFSSPEKTAIYNKFMKEVPMAGYIDKAGKAVKGIENYLPKTQYDREEHRAKVVEDILDNWITISQNSKFHAIFATSSIAEAIAYYGLFKKKPNSLKITALFDPNIDNNGGALYKEDGLVEILQDYNLRYGQDFTLATHAKFKRDVAARLAHKEPYLRIERIPGSQIDLLIVVDQMLTGFDSKWVNTLFLDKVLKYESIIQAFSRTNRLFGSGKPHGTIRYYRMPHTMEQNIEKAVKLYSGDKPVALFAQRLEGNLKMMNTLYEQIAALFNRADVANFEKLPADPSERAVFARLFKELSQYLEAARIQGFNWGKSEYEFGKGRNKTVVGLSFDKETYLILALRYKELSNIGSGIGATSDVPFEIDTYLTEIDTGLIDANYMNSRFKKFLKTLKQEGRDSENLQAVLDELHKSFASLTQEEQKFANLFIHDVHNSLILEEPDKSFREYITEYQHRAKNDEIRQLTQALGVDEAKLRAMMHAAITEANINEYGRFNDLKNTVDPLKAKAYFERLEGKSIPAYQVKIKTQSLLQDFILKGGFEIESPGYSGDVDPS